MTNYDDSKWEHLEGGYGIPFDPRPALAKIEADGDRAAWAELWEELHHQGEVGQASYAAIPILARISASASDRDWNVFALASTIELARESEDNPDLPDWLDADYEAAWEQLFKLARADLVNASDPMTLRCLLATISIAKGDPRRGRMLLEFDEDELDEILGDEN